MLLVRQFRVATGDVLLEIPAGGLEVDRASGTVEDPDRAARRELLEETGHEASAWRRLASFWTAPGFATELMHLYLATGLTAVRDRIGEDDDERLELVRLPFEEALARADSGEIHDAKSLVALYRLARLRAAGEV